MITDLHFIMKLFHSHMLWKREIHYCAPQIHSHGSTCPDSLISKHPSHLLLRSFCTLPPSFGTALQYTELEETTEPQQQTAMARRASRFKGQKAQVKNCAAQRKIKIAKCCQQTGEDTKNTPAKQPLQTEEVSNSNSCKHTRISV